MWNIFSCRYCLNCIFLLRLKAHRSSNLERHPVVKRLLKISKYLREIDVAENAGLRNQIMKIAKTLTQNKVLDKKLIVLDSPVKKDREITGKNRLQHF